MLKKFIIRKTAINEIIFDSTRKLGRLKLVNLKITRVNKRKLISYLLNIKIYLIKLIIIMNR